MMGARFGRIVFVGSLASSIGSTGAPIYCVSKASLEALSRSLGIDYSRYGITTNVARLGFTDTERLRERIANEPERAESYAAAMATRRLVRPEEAANAIAFLCSRHSGSIVGTVLDVTGGLELASSW
jgi:NAD(P)-dependent dehydrogenase (short-subunit alcohol dehydrogenase family)